MKQTRGLIPYQIVGAFDAYGGARYKKVFREVDGTLSQAYPGHADGFINSQHKKWRWWVAERRLDGPELMHWTPDVEELDQIERIVERCLSFTPDIPRYSLNGEYPNWPKVHEPK